MKVIIAGGRDYSDYTEAKEFFDKVLVYQTDVEVVSGRCSTGVHTFTTDDGVKVYGVDGLGERYAKERGFKVTPFPADWSLGKKAGPLRNKKMAEYAEALMAIWDGKSSGTKNMIETAKQQGLKTRIKIENNG